MNLKDMEMMIIRYSALGYTDRETAAELKISESYVRWLLNNLFGKTYTKNKAHLVSWAYKNKVIGTEEKGE